MIRWFLTAFLIFVPPVAIGQPASLPPELAPLEEFYDKENGLVDVVRAFHLTQKALARWDEELIPEMISQGDETRARELAESIPKRYELVRVAYEEVLKRYPENARALNYYGELLYDNLGDPQKALQLWKQAAALDGGLAEARNNLALHYSHSGDYRLAIEYFDQALKLDPDNPDFLFNLAQIYLINWPQVAEIRSWDHPRVYREGMKLSKKARDTKPDDFTLASDYAVNFFAAERFQIEADWREAAKAWQHARKTARDAGEVFYSILNEARVWEAAGSSEKALELLDQALEIWPESEAAQKLKARVSGKKGAGS